MNKILSIIKNEQHRRIVSMYYIDGDPLAFIAKQEGLSVQGVSNILGNTLQKIRASQKGYTPIRPLAEWNDKFVKGMLKQETRKDCVVCWICGRVFETISRTHLQKHEMSRQEYIHLFPDAMLISQKGIRKNKRKPLKK